MSGGSYDYFYSKIEEFAERINKSTPQRRAFYNLLCKVADAAHDIEWVDSGDYGKGDENEAIAKCVSPKFSLDQAMRDARQAIEDIQTTISEAEKSQ